MKNIQTIPMLLCLVILSGIISCCSPANSNNTGKATHIQEQNNQSEAADRFIEDLENFVSSVEKQSVIQSGDWQNTRELWNALQKRKEGLIEKFSDEQMERIQLLESRFRVIDEQNNKG